jgi:signal transduction histidine kinase
MAGKRFFISSRPVKEYIAFREPIPEERWHLGLVRAETPLFIAFRRSQILFFVILASGLAMAIAGAFFISQKITAPISGLAFAAQKLAQGHLESRVAVTERDEIGELAADFNQMATDLKQLMRERQANETLLAVGRFSAALAHDLRNPVEGLKLLSRELGKRVEPQRPEREIADTIVQSVERLSSLVNQSLDFARLNQPAFAATDLVALTEEVLQDFCFREVELKKDYAHDLPPAKIDAAQIKRVLANLLRNALEACFSKKDSARCQISLTLQTNEEKVRIEVADTGPGIPVEIQEKIFDPFFSTKPAGHGLGLALVRQIISNHGGRIAFASEMGQGTRFVIELPVAK